MQPDYPHGTLQPRLSEPATSEVIPDEVLVRRWQRGDLSGASLAIQRHERVVFGAALRLLRNPADAEDAAQETFLRAHERIGTLREGAALPGWLRQICVRLCIDQLRRKRPFELEVVDDLSADPRPGVAEQAELRDVLERFEAALDALPPGQRVVVILRDVEGFDTRETAELLGISGDAAKMRLSRARAVLRRALAEEPR